MRNLYLLTLATTLALAFACNDDPNGNGNGNGDGNSNGNGDANNNGDSNNNGGVNPDNPQACKIVDVVFSLDGSGSMNQERAAMSDVVFPAFAAELTNIGDGLDNYRVGVLDACALKADFHTKGNDGNDCGFYLGNQYMISESPDLEDEFSCVGDIYSGDSTENEGAGPCTGSNDDEQPASASAAALEESAPGGLNEGFLRDDALLVVVAITDEDEQPTNGDDAEDIYNRLVATKGDVKKMVFLGIGGGTQGGCISPYDENGSTDYAALLKETTELFIDEERGIWWNLCDGSLEDGLAEAMAVIEQACEEFPPPQID